MTEARCVSLRYKNQIDEKSIKESTPEVVVETRVPLKLKYLGRPRSFELMPIGLTIFILAFVLIASTAASYLARPTKSEQVSIDPAHVPPVTINVNQASDLMQRRCSKCHNLERVVAAR